LTASLLDELTAGAAEDAARRAEARPRAAVEAAAAARPPAHDAVAALAHDPAGARILAEVKRASPSRGRMAEIPDPAALARE
jgi:indole-3-glycerol phosphate synthase